jgi:DNA adenine methylase
VARLISGDFSKVLSHAKPGDFVYLDPPHATTARRIFTEYGPRPFGQEDIDRLGAWLDRLTAQKVEFLLSYADSPEGRQLAKGYASRTVTVRRNIAGFAANRRLSTEILVNNRPMLAR